MANPYDRKNTEYPPYTPPSSNNNNNNNGNIQDLSVPYYGRQNPPSSLTPVPPPHTQPLETYNPYPRTEDTKSPFVDYSTPYTSSPHINEGPTPGSYQRQSYFGKPTDSYPYGETNINAPTPPPPPKPRTLFSRMFNGHQRFAWFCWIISVIQIGVFIGELIKNTIVQHTPIQIQPTFNPLIGPSSYVCLRSKTRRLTIGTD